MKIGEKLLIQATLKICTKYGSMLEIKIEKSGDMKFNFKEYEEQDLVSKGPMRRRYNELVERYKGYIIYSYIRGEYKRYSVEDKNENIFVETDNIEEAREYVDTELSK